MDIKEALDQLDSLNDEHWTDDGFPALKAVSEIMGREVSRKEIIDADPSFSRSSEAVVDSLPELTPIEKEEVETTLQFEDLQKEIIIKQKQMDVIKQELEKLYSASAILDLRLSRIKRAKGVTKSTAIQDYLKKVQETRLRKAARLSSITGSGVSIRELVASINPKSKIDQALNQRKASPGSTRPAAKIPVRK